VDCQTSCLRSGGVETDSWTIVIRVLLRSKCCVVFSGD
jgi:hypothetical protein